jgi:hypothetical protein
MENNQQSKEFKIKVGQQLEDVISKHQVEQLKLYMETNGKEGFDDNFLIKLFDVIEAVMKANGYKDCTDCEAILALERNGIKQPFVREGYERPKTDA